MKNIVDLSEKEIADYTDIVSKTLENAGLAPFAAMYILSNAIATLALAGEETIIELMGEQH